MKATEAQSVAIVACGRIAHDDELVTIILKMDDEILDRGSFDGEGTFFEWLIENDFSWDFADIAGITEPGIYRVSVISYYTPEFKGETPMSADWGIQDVESYQLAGVDGDRLWVSTATWPL